MFSVFVPSKLNQFDQNSLDQITRRYPNVQIQRNPYIDEPRVVFFGKIIQKTTLSGINELLYKYAILTTPQTGEKNQPYQQIMPQAQEYKLGTQTIDFNAMSNRK